METSFFASVVVLIRMRVEVRVELGCACEMGGTEPAGVEGGERLAVLVLGCEIFCRDVACCARETATVCGAVRLSGAFRSNFGDDALV